MRNALQSFEFVLLVVVLGHVGGQCCINLSAIQGCRPVDGCWKIEDSFWRPVILSWTIFWCSWGSQKSLQCLGVETVFKDKRVGKKKRHFDELCEDTRFDNPEYRFRVSVFHRLIDTVTSQITQRFSATTELVTKFSILFPHVLSLVNNWRTRHYKSSGNSPTAVQLRLDRSFSCSTGDFCCFT